jgi:hypothetical protein
MPYIVKNITRVNGKHNCVLPDGPTNVNPGDRPGPGSLWQCLFCGQYWEVVEDSNGKVGQQKILAVGILEKLKLLTFLYYQKFQKEK